MKAVIYARVSSTDESQSFERQIDDLKRWADYLNLNIIDVFAEKISGFKKGLDDRVEFNKMLDFIKENNIKHILISELSRLSRRYIDSINFINDCTLKGISIHIQKEGLSTLDKDGEENSTVQMLTGMLSSIAQQESKSLSFRIKSGKQFSASKGGGFNKKIYGYDKGDDGLPVIDESQAILVRKMFEMLLQGFGVRTISNYLNENYDTKEWKSASVHSIVRNSFFCGKRKYKATTIDVPAIVDVETFEKAQAFIDKRKRFASKVGTHVNPFASFIKCECGAVMHQVIIKSGNLNVYRCASNCGVKSVNRDFLIAEVKQVLEKNAKLSKDEEVRERMKLNIITNKSDIITNEKRIKALKIMSDKNYERFLLGKMVEQKYDTYENKFNTELKAIKNDIKESLESIRAIESGLKNKIIHYSDDLPVLKLQMLKSIEWIEVKKEMAVVKIKGWAKVIIVLYRGGELQKYNNFRKRILLKKGKDV